MTPHEYAVIGHKRSEVGRWIGAAAAFLAPLITSKAMDLTKGQISALTVSTTAVYLALHWLFDNYGWRGFYRIFPVPDLSGTWEVVGKTLNQDMSIRYEWSATLKITQTWDRIAIELKTTQSGSYSESASLKVKHDGGVILSYSYQNHPRAGEPELQKHQGFCQLEFDAERNKAEGHYFNSMGRFTVGQMALTKVKVKA